MSESVQKEHNVSTLMYHVVCSVKYRRAVISEEVDKKLRKICLGIEARYEMKFWVIGTERDHVHFVVQSVTTYSLEQIVRIIKGITARKIFEVCPEVKKDVMGRRILAARILCWDGRRTRGCGSNTTIYQETRVKG